MHLVVAVCATAAGATLTAQRPAQILHSFAGGTVGDGAYPPSTVVQMPGGDLYGTTAGGGLDCSAGCVSNGTVFKITPAGQLSIVKILGSVWGNDPGNPHAHLILATDGNFYGTTRFGGTSYMGAVIRMAPDGTVTNLHSFTGEPLDGAEPAAALVQASNGDLYGTAFLGGAANRGIVFKITLAGGYSVLHSFAGSPIDGFAPLAALVQANDGNLYGTTVGNSQDGSSTDYGSIFKMTLAGTLTRVHEFKGGLNDGMRPQAALLQAADGSLYGTSTQGGGNACGGFGCGTIFKTSLGGEFSVVHSFVSATDGSGPVAALIQTADRNFYGTTSSGHIFRMTPSGTFSVVRTAGSSLAPVTHAANGLFYGTTYDGGAHAFGTVFRFAPPGLVVSQVYGGGGNAGAPYQNDFIELFNRSRLPISLDGMSVQYAPADSSTWSVTPLPNIVVQPGQHVLIQEGSSGGNGSPLPPPDAIGTIDIAASGGKVALPTTTVALPGGCPQNISWVVDFVGYGAANCFEGAAAAAAALDAFADLRGAVGCGDTENNAADFVAAVPVPRNTLAALRLCRFQSDVDGDWKSDRIVWRPSTGAWYSSLGGGIATWAGWGVSGDIDVAADYDGDGRTDVAVFRPSTGTWFIVHSNDGSIHAVTWGTSGDIPLTGDIDGDGKDDLAIFRPGAGTWYINKSGGGTTVLGWGVAGDQALLADYDGDGKADPTIYRSGNGGWYIARSSGGTEVVGWGEPGDIPVAGDFDGDAKADITVFRPSTGQWRSRKSTGGILLVTWGVQNDTPISGDWDGDGSNDFTVWRESAGTWFTQYASGGTAVVGWGTSGDKPIGRRPGS